MAMTFRLGLLLVVFGVSHSVVGCAPAEDPGVADETAEPLVLEVRARYGTAPIVLQVVVEENAPFSHSEVEDGVHWKLEGWLGRVVDGKVRVRRTLEARAGVSGVRSSVGGGDGVELTIGELNGTAGSRHLMSSLWIRRGRDPVPSLRRILVRRDRDFRPAAIAVGRLGVEGRAAIPDLIDVLRDGDDGPETTSDRAYESLRRYACRALGEIGVAGEDVEATLTTALTDENGYVRVAAAVALWRISSHPAGIEVLLAECTAAHRDIRLHAVVGLGDVASGATADRAVPALIAVLRGDEWSGARMQAAYALGKFAASARSARPALDEALEDPEEDVRRAAAHARDAIDP